MVLVLRKVTNKVNESAKIINISERFISYFIVIGSVCCLPGIMLGFKVIKKC